MTSTAISPTIPTEHADQLVADLLDLSENDPVAALYNAARVIRFLETQAVSKGFMRGHSTSTSPSFLQAFVS